MLDEISRKFPHLRLFGIDVSDRMCQTAKRNAPQAQIHCGPYGRQSGLAGTFDHVVARSTLTYVDEADIQNILTWLASITNMVLLISEPNGGDDAEHICTGQLDIAVLGDGVYKRLYDHTHIRQYSRYQLTGLKLVHTAKELAHGGGNTQWLFVRESAQTTLSGS